MVDRAYFESTEWREQQREGFSPGAAWLDILGLTNQKPTQMTVRGIVVDLARGQCGWSKKGLAERWGWSQGKVSRVLTGWSRRGRITEKTSNETTIITIINYEDYQTGLRTLCEQTESRRGTNSEQTGTEKGEGRRDYRGTQGEKGEGNGDVPPTRVVTLEMALKWFRENGDSGYTDEQITAEWLYFDGRRGPGGEWLTERGQVWTDWRSALTAGLMKSFRKNGATQTGTNGRSAAQERFLIDRELAELEEAIEACRQSGAQPDANDVTREKNLRKKLAGFQTA